MTSAFILLLRLARRLNQDTKERVQFVPGWVVWNGDDYFGTQPCFLRQTCEKHISDLCTSSDRSF